MKIFVVEDEDTNALILKKILEDKSHEVHFAYNGAQAVAQIDTINPDLILMDILMPVIDGYQATKLIKEKMGERFVPIIFITSMDGDEALISCLENGGDDYISKPFNKHVLYAKISAMERIRTLHNTIRDQKQHLQELNNYNRKEQIIAEKIFKKVMSKGELDSPVIDSFHQPADTFNGDIVMSVNSPYGGMNFLVGDFTGHGLAAALCSMPVVQIFYVMSYKGYGIQDIIKEINRKTIQFLPKGRFFAACILNIDVKNHKLKLWNGGMPDAYFLNEDLGIREKLISNKVPLGIVDNDQLDTTLNIYEIHQNDRLFIYSDGLVEAHNEKDEMYGQSRLEDVIHSCHKSESLVSEVKSNLDQFIQNKPFQDDVTMLEIRCDFEKFNTQKDGVVAIPRTGDWELSLRLDSNKIQTTEPIPIMIAVLNEMQEFRNHRETLFTIVTEMYSNSLEHGLLKLDSNIKKTAEGFAKYYQLREEGLQKLEKGFIKIRFRHGLHANGGTLYISMEDSGDGFDVERAVKDMGVNKYHHGRGLAILQTLCNEVSHNAKGNEVHTVFEWTNLQTEH